MTSHLDAVGCRGETRSAASGQRSRTVGKQGVVGSTHRSGAVTDEVCEIVVTAPDAEWLIEFGRRLVTDRLAASVHNLTPIRSIYEW